MILRITLLLSLTVPAIAQSDITPLPAVSGVVTVVDPSGEFEIHGRIQDMTQGKRVRMTAETVCVVNEFTVPPRTR